MKDTYVVLAGTDVIFRQKTSGELLRIFYLSTHWRDKPAAQGLNLIPHLTGDRRHIQFNMEGLACPAFTTTTIRSDGTFLLPNIGKGKFCVAHFEPLRSQQKRTRLVAVPKREMVRTTGIKRRRKK